MIADSLRTIRLSLGLTQDELAARLGWDRRRISTYETGRTMPHPKLVRAMADAMGATVDEAYGLTPVRKDLS